MPDIHENNSGSEMMQEAPVIVLIMFRRLTMVIQITMHWRM